eukprot:7168958-Lingulodinium_polyedra.AAC.1
MAVRARALLRVAAVDDQPRRERRVGAVNRQHLHGRALVRAPAPHREQVHPIECFGQIHDE